MLISDGALAHQALGLKPQGGSSIPLPRAKARGNEARGNKSSGNEACGNNTKGFARTLWLSTYFVEDHK
jgi:hypothetical protein